MRARSLALRRSDVHRALSEDRSIVRTWLMRGTLHVVAADDVRWLVRLLGPVFASGDKTRHAQLGLTDELKSRGLRAIHRILAQQGPLTRYEIVDRLGRLGIHLDPKSQAPIHLIAFAAFNAVCCLGPDRKSGEPTYVLLDDWVTPNHGPRRALGELARRYFSAYGPAAPEDFAAWSGLPAGQVRTAIAEAMSGLDEVSTGGQSLFLPKRRRNNWRLPNPARQDVRLLPAFDTYLLGYRSRDLAVDRSLQKRLQRGGGWIHPAVIVQGRAIAAWKLVRTSSPHIVLEPDGRMDRSITAALHAEIDDVFRFLGVVQRDVRGNRQQRRFPANVSS